MADITLAADETAATTLVLDAESALGTVADSGSDTLGPFTASWSGSVFFANGSVDLIAPNIIRIADCEVHYSFSFTFSIDLSSILPDFCLPRVCIFGLCTPRICIDWPTIPIPISFSDVATFTADFTLAASLSGGVWKVDIVIVGIPSLTLGLATAALIVAVGAAAGLVLLAVPFIGPFLAGAVVAITAAIGIAGATGFLGAILTPFVSGLTFNIYNQPQVFPVLPAAGALDPAVNINIDSLAATVESTDEDELVITADISA